MPNHTSTLLTVTGVDKEIESFIEKAVGKGSTGSEAFNEGVGKEPVLSFQSLYPLPSDLVGTRAPSNPETDEEKEHSEHLRQLYGYDNWYDWCIENWSTKWDCYDQDEEWNVEDVDGGKSIKLFYYTAWSPATNFYTEVSKQFPGLLFRHEFADEGGSFLGYEEFQNGEMTDMDEFDWDSDDGKELRDRLGIVDWEEEE